MKVRLTAIPPDLVIVLALGVVTATVTVFAIPNVGLIRAVAGLPFMLFGVGYAAMRAMLPSTVYDTATQVATSVAVSIAVTICAALILNAIGLKFDARSAILADLVVATGATVIAVVRAAPAATMPRVGTDVMRLTIALLAPIGVIVVAIVVLSHPLPNRTIATSAALWITPGPDGQVKVGINNDLEETSPFIIRVSVGRAIVANQSVTVAPGRVRSFDLRVQTASRQPVVANLYLSRNPDRIYRQVMLQP